jgi:hypothetical protein
MCHHSTNKKNNENQNQISDISNYLANDTHELFLCNPDRPVDNLFPVSCNSRIKNRYPRLIRVRGKDAQNSR